MENKALIYVIAKGGNLPQTEFWFIKSNQLLAEFGVVKAESPIMFSEAEGFEGPKFMNTCLVFSTHCAPNELLIKLKHIEQISGRNKTYFRKNYESRVLDLDIIACGNLNYFSKTLKIPHPNASNRIFVTEPIKWLIKNNFLEKIDLIFI
jgi:2-amino-4-hydroxy-6-hydroxymethyldihydropteridine diphosphokinase